jgi:hypothetical protein
MRTLPLVIPRPLVPSADGSRGTKARRTAAAIASDHVIGELPDLGGARLPARREAHGGGESPPASPECGRCQADGGGTLVGLLTLGLLRRRRTAQRARG